MARVAQLSSFHGIFGMAMLFNSVVLLLMKVRGDVGEGAVAARLG